MTPPTWPRPHYEPGGGDATIAYAAYGTFPLTPPIDRGRYRVAGLPAGVTMLKYARKDSPQGFAHFLRGEPWRIAAGERPEVAARAEASAECILLRGDVADPATLDYFRDVIGTLTYLVDGGAVAIYDLLTFTLWDPAAWFTAVFNPGEPNPTEHALIFDAADAKPGLARLTTRGMRKFGRPDLMIRGVGPQYRETALNLLNRYIEWQAFGGVIRAGDRIRIEGLPAGGECVPGGDPADPEFNNAHVELVWPPGVLGR